MRRIALLVAAAACALPSARSQTTSPAVSPTKSPDDAAIQLSPFVVSTQQDTGWVAQNTLAGSRMNTPLSDLAAAISPMTGEFLRDIAATNLDDAMEYGLGTRLETQDGRAAGPVADFYSGANQRQVRIRGLGGGSRTLDYFPSLIGTDLYNIGRLDISRGPNSILYGFGSPAGVVNAATKKAEVGREFYNTTFRFDSWNGKRASADANTPLIKDRLSLRSDYLWQQNRSWRDAGYDNQNRLFLTSTWTPDKKTTVTGSFEYGKRRFFTPRPFYGLDFLSLWNAAGNPTFNNYDPTLKPGSVGTPGNPFRDSGTLAVNGTKELTVSPWVVASNAFPYAQNYYRFTVSAPQDAPQLLDFPHAMTNRNAVLEANFVHSTDTNRTYMVDVQRELLPNLNLDLGAFYQTDDSITQNLANWEMYGAQGDPNTYYPDGTPKPASNRFYFDNSPMLTRTPASVRDYRGTLAYEHDFSENNGWSQWLGRWRFAGLGEWQKTSSTTYYQYLAWMNGADVNSGGAFSPDPTNSANRVYMRYYVDPADFNNPHFRIPAPLDLSGGVPYKDPATGQVRTIYADFVNRNPPNRYYDTQGTQMAVGQTYLLKNHLVLTAGIRQDKLKHYAAPTVQDPAAGMSGTTPMGQWIALDTPSTPTGVATGRTKTYGGVLHVTKWLSVFANYSDSANVPTTNLAFGTDPSSPNIAVLPPLRTGKTHDYGVKLTLIPNRMFLNVTRFNTRALDDTDFSGWQARSDIVTIWRALANVSTLPADEKAIAQAQYLGTNAIRVYRYDSKSEGYEFELSGQVLPNWTVYANLSRSVSTRDNVATEFRRYLDYWKPMFLKYGNYSLTQSLNNAAPVILDRPVATPDVFKATGNPLVNNYHDNIYTQLVHIEDEEFNNPYLFQGKRFPGDPKYDMNFRTRYDFHQSWLKGISVGAGIRMRRNAVAGAVTTWDLLPNSSYTDPHNGRQITSIQSITAKDQQMVDFQIGYARRIFGRVGWRLQLNVNNALDDRDLILSNVNTATGAFRTYRYQDPRQFILTSSFDF